MSPPLTFQMTEALRRRWPLLLLAEIEHPDGTARFWSGVGRLPWNGETWIGSGTLGTITPIRRTSDLVIQELTFALAAVDPAVVATLNDNVRNRAGRAWLACLDPEGGVVADPMPIVDAELDYQTFSAGDDGKVGIAITARTGFYTLDRALDEAWTSEEQRLLFPDDSGLDMISGLQNQTLQWTPT